MQRALPFRRHGLGLPAAAGGNVATTQNRIRAGACFVSLTKKGAGPRDRRGPTVCSVSAGQPAGPSRAGGRDGCATENTRRSPGSEHVLARTVIATATALQEAHEEP